MRPHELVYTKYLREGISVYEVDTKQSRWFGTFVKDLGAFGRRRFENWVVLERPKERIKVLYV